MNERNEPANNQPAPEEKQSFGAGLNFAMLSKTLRVFYFIKTKNQK